jgi:hypothetical protein
MIQEGHQQGDTEMDKLTNLIASANAYISNQPKMALVYIEQAGMIASELGLPVIAADLFNLYIATKVRAFG